MSRYLSIVSIQRPFDIGPDSNNRPQVSCNYECHGAGPLTAFEDEILKLIVNAGLGVQGTTLFKGRAAVLPASGDGPFVQLISTSGNPNLETHNGDKYERPTFQILVRAKTYSAATSRAVAIWRALDGQRDITVVA
jgi:hypothetical protein